MATVFARLKVPSPDGSGAIDDHGVHAFIVPLRDESGKIAEGVEIRDCGYKVRAPGDSVKHAIAMLAMETALRQHAHWQMGCMLL